MPEALAWQNAGAMQSMSGRLERGPDRILAGVCSGLAYHLDLDPLWVRIVFLILALAGGVGVLLYLALWILIPDAGQGGVQTAADVGSSVRGMGQEVWRAGESAWAAFSSGQAGPPPGEPPSSGAGPGGPGGPVWQMPPRRFRHRGVTGGLVLILVGLWFLLANLGLLNWWQWNIAWPLILILIGLAILVQRLR